jgi:WD40 repeat protein
MHKVAKFVSLPYLGFTSAHKNFYECLYYMKTLTKDVQYYIIQLYLIIILDYSFSLSNQIDMMFSSGPITFSPNDKFISNGTRFWDTKIGNFVKKIENGGDISSVTWNSNSDNIIIVLNDTLSYLYNITTGKLIQEFDYYSSEIWSVKIQTNFIGLNELLYFYNIPNRDRKMPIKYKFIKSIILSPNNKNYLDGSATSGMFLLRSIETNSVLGYFEGYVAVFSPDSSTILTARDNMIRLWCTFTGKLLNTFVGHTGTVYSLDFSPDGKTIIAGSIGEPAFLWDVNTGKLLTCLKQWDHIHNVIFSYSGNKIATCDFHSGILKIWDRCPYYSNELITKRKKSAFELYKELYLLINFSKGITQGSLYHLNTLKSIFNFISHLILLKFSFRIFISIFISGYFLLYCC